MADNKNNSGWLIVAALLGAGIAGKATYDSKKKKQLAEQKRLEQEKLENERLDRENSFGHKLGQFLGEVFKSVENKKNETREKIQERVSCASDTQLQKWINSDEPMLREAVKEEIKRRNPYGLYKTKLYK